MFVTKKELAELVKLQNNTTSELNVLKSRIDLLTLEFKKLREEQNYNLEQEVKRFDKDLEFARGSINVFKLEISRRLDDFHKEISSKYIDAIEKVIQTTKETMLIDTLIKQVSGKDIDNLKRTLIQPVLEERWKETQAKKFEEADRIISSKGQKIAEMRDSMYQRFLKLDREGKDTTLLKAQLEIMDNILEVTDEKKNI